MDTRIILDYIRRWAWGYGVAILLYLAYGFYTGRQPVITILFMMFFLTIGIAPELQRQGPLWMHRTLPVREQVLMRTVWWLAVVMPVITLATCFLPALAFGLVTGRSNTATTHLITFIAAGFLLTSVSFLYLNLGNFEWKSRLVRGYVVLGATLLMFTGMFFVVTSELDWNAMHLRLGLIVTAPLLVMLSYVFAPHVMSAAGPNTNGQRTLQPGKSQTKNTMSMRDRILATPSGRALVGGLFLPGLALCMHLIVAQQLVWWNLPAGHKFMVWGIGMLPFLLYLGSTPHMTSFRGMASLPISRTRRTLTFVRLPVAAVVPLVMFLTTLAVFAKTNSTGYLQLTAVVLSDERLCRHSASCSRWICGRNFWRNRNVSGADSTVGVCRNSGNTEFIHPGHPDTTERDHAHLPMDSPFTEPADQRVSPGLVSPGTPTRVATKRNHTAL